MIRDKNSPRTKIQTGFKVSLIYWFNEMSLLIRLNQEYRKRDLTINRAVYLRPWSLFLVLLSSDFVGYNLRVATNSFSCDVTSTLYHAKNGAR